MRVPTTTPDMFPGLLGELTTAATDHTEASAVAIASQFLVAFSVAVGRGPHTFVGETRHGVNEGLLVIGTTAVARKGDGKNVGLIPLAEAAGAWFNDCVSSGLSSGEGLIHAVRDPVFAANSKGEPVEIDAGVADKRLLVIESEFAQVLKMFTREGNILSTVMRNAWDGHRVLKTMTKRNPVKATEAHIGFIGHTTPEDLRHYLADVDIKNGVANRFLYAAVHRACSLPSPSRLPGAVRAHLTSRTTAALQHGAQVEDLGRTPAAEKLWHAVYDELTAERAGIQGDLLARAQAHVLRLSMLFALLDCALVVDAVHLTSALAWWDYVVASVGLIFEGRTGNPDADRILAELLPGEPRTRDQIRRDIFSNHITEGRLKDALDLLTRLGFVKVYFKPTPGRSALMVERLGAIGTTAEEAVG